jgi:hypothetical protein
MTTLLSRYLREIWPFATLTCVITLTLWLSAVQRANDHWNKAEELLTRGEVMRATRHYQWAARAYYPSSSIGPQALDKLWIESQAFKSKGQIEQALMCLDLLRGAIWSTRWLMTPYRSWHMKVDQEIVTLRGNQLDRSKLMLVLKHDPLPTVTRSLCLLISVLAMLLSVINLLSNGLTRELKVTTHTWRGVIALSLTLIGVVLSLAT